MSAENPTQIHATGEATGFIPAPGDKGKPITVIGTNSIRAGFDATCLQQALNVRSAPGVTDLAVLDSVKAAGLASEIARLKSPLRDQGRGFQFERSSVIRRIWRPGRNAFSMKLVSIQLEHKLILRV
jgi:hypothetical protein